MVEIRRLTTEEGRQHLGALAYCLLDCVDGGASVGFMAPLSKADAVGFFENVLKGVQKAERILLAAFVDSRLVGTVQVLVSMPANQPHRAEVAKLLVVRAARGKGVGSRLMVEAEEVSRLAGKTLLVLDTATGDSAERLYLQLGWTRIGVIPMYAKYPDGRWGDTSFFWKRL